jgi:asparagine synthase (glutamine-hydrolysing)
MGERSGRFWIVYNGEVYNYVELREQLERSGHAFETSSDTEVVLRAWIEWGERAPERFEGGFAFAVYDRLERSVFLVRDRFGKRPLFYRSEGAALVFASEIKAFLGRPGAGLEWSADHLAALFTHWVPFAEETPFVGVRQVPAATVVRVAASGLSETVYARSPFDVGPGDLDFESAAAAARSALTEAVRLRLRSDVEVGVLLSGGLDSSIVTRLVREQRPERLRAFSIRFADRRFDESAHQERVARALGVPLASIEVRTGDVAEAFRAALWHAEVPQFRTALVPMFLLSRFIAEHGVKVVLSGEGADESFLGYDIFKETRLRAAWPSLDSERRLEAIRGLYPYLEHFSEANLRALGAWFAQWAGDPSEPLFPHQPRFENGRFAARLLHAAPAAATERLGDAMARDAAVRGLPLMRRAQWIEFHTLLQGYLLSSQGDRMTFAHGVESRCPFLSPRVVELAASLPETHLLSPEGDEKRLLKHVFRSELPSETLDRPKQPYRAPDAESFFAAPGEARFLPWVEDLLAPQELRRVGPLDPEPAARLLAKLRRTPAGQVSPRDAQAFVLLLSLVVLDRQLVRRVDAPPRPVRVPLLRSIDLVGGERRAAEGR